MKKKLGFFGAGKMAEGIVQAVAATGNYDLKDVVMAESYQPRAKEMAKRYRVKTVPDVEQAAKETDAIFLSVKPQDVAAVAERVKPLLTSKKLVVSIVAGKSLATLRKMFGAKVRLIRVMPNLALRAKEGMCAICPAKNATKADVKLVSSILGAAGQTAVLKEKDFDAVTALSGSGPAFFAFMEEAMAEGGVKLGLKPDVARKLAEQTMLGTAAYLRQSGADLGEFIAGVATKGGTTAAGMDVLRASEFKDIVASTLAAAATRSAELGK
jgi:pyrroline-5-carboxylate reductase